VPGAGCRVPGAGCRVPGASAAGADDEADEAERDQDDDIVTTESSPGNSSRAKELLPAISAISNRLLRQLRLVDFAWLLLRKLYQNLSCKSLNRARGCGA